MLASRMWAKFLLVSLDLFCVVLYSGSKSFVVVVAREPKVGS